MAATGDTGAKRLSDARCRSCGSTNDLFPVKMLQDGKRWVVRHLCIACVPTVDADIASLRSELAAARARLTAVQDALDEWDRHDWRHVIPRAVVAAALSEEGPTTKEVSS